MFKQKKNRKKKRMTKNQALILVSVVSIAFITIGYAVMNQVLNIRGYATIDVGDGMMFNRVDVKGNNGAIIDSVASIKAKTMVTTKVSFEGTGSITYTVAAQNQGEYDAKLIEIQKLNNLNGQAPQCIQTTITNHSVGESVYPGVVKTFDVTITSTCTEYSSKEIEVYFKYKKQETQGGELPLPPSGNLVEYLLNHRVKQHVDDGKNGLVAIGNDGEITTSSTPREYRYIGPNPDNYVYFNGELWRIIGVFDGQLKIVRANVFDEEMEWDVENGNDWSTASLQEYLNGEYLESMNPLWKDMISDYAWKLGGGEYEYLTTQEFYEKEHGTEAYEGNPTEWTGKISLIYASDYGFSTSGGSTTNRSSCLATNLYGLHQTDKINLSDCKNNNWLGDWGANYASGYWTLTVNGWDISTEYATYSPTVVTDSATVTWDSVSSINFVRPSLFLKSSLEIASGSGEEGDPFVLVGGDTSSTQIISSTRPKGNLAECLINKRVKNDVSVGKNGLVAIGNDGEITTSDLAHEYRYIGSNPSNYVLYNDELWQIIGIFDGQLKIIRAEALDEWLEWNVNGTNDWSTASLQEYLNGEYLESMNPLWENMISDYTWKLGEDMPEDDSIPLEWTGKLALMDADDYRFSTSGGFAVDRSSCLYNGDGEEDCYLNSWLYDEDNEQWTLTPEVIDGDDSVFNVTSDGYVSTIYVGEQSGVRPTLFLKSEIKVIGGNGAEWNPFILGEKELVAIGNDGKFTTSNSPREYRYVGTNPDNYVKFNNELWRIIGIFDGQFKIIRASELDTVMPWDNNINDWSRASLQTYLNGEYLNSIDNTSQSYISDYTWNLGGSKTYDGVTAQMFYEREHGTEVYTGRPTKWTGKIALMYPSDYGFTMSGGITNDGSSCSEVGINDWSLACIYNSWLYNRTGNEWTLTPYANSADDVSYVAMWSGISTKFTGDQLDIRPTLYLKPNVKTVSGTGTKIDPFILGT